MALHPPLLDTTIAPTNKTILTSPHLFIQEETTPITTQKTSIKVKITFLFRIFIQIKLIQNKKIFYSLFERTKGAPTSQFKR